VDDENIFHSFLSISNINGHFQQKFSKPVIFHETNGASMYKYPPSFTKQQKISEKYPYQLIIRVALLSS